jgi:HEAT repeat protein
MILGDEPDDLFLYRHRLAALCLAETNRYSAQDQEFVRTLDRMATRLLSVWWRSAELPSHDHLLAACQAVLQVGRRLGGEEAVSRYLSPLLDSLGPSSAYEACAAAEALGRLGPVAAIPRVRDALVAALRVRGDRRLRARAIEALSRLGPSMAAPNVRGALRRLRKCKDAQIASAAAQALCHLGYESKPAESREELLKALSSTDLPDKARQEAANRLGQLGPLAVSAETRAALLFALNHPGNPGLRRCAARAVGQLGPTIVTEDLLDGLLEAMEQGRDEGLCRQVVRTLGRLGPGAGVERVLDSLLAIMKNDTTTPRIRRATVLTFGQLGRKSVSDELFHLVLRSFHQHGDRKLRRRAAWTLARLWPSESGDQIIDSLLEDLCRADDDKVLSDAEKGLKGMLHVVGNDRLISVLLAIVHSQRDTYRQSIAIRLLGFLGPFAATARVRDALLPIARDRDNPILRPTAIWALGKLGQTVAAAETCQVLVEALSPSEKCGRSIRGRRGRGPARIGEGHLSGCGGPLPDPHRPGSSDVKEGGRYGAPPDPGPGLEVLSS